MYFTKYNKSVLNHKYIFQNSDFITATFKLTVKIGMHGKSVNLLGINVLCCHYICKYVF